MLYCKIYFQSLNKLKSRVGFELSCSNLKISLTKMSLNQFKQIKARA